MGEPQITLDLTRDQQVAMLATFTLRGYIERIVGKPILLVAKYVTVGAFDIVAFFRSHREEQERYLTWVQHEQNLVSRSVDSATIYRHGKNLEYVAFHKGQPVEKHVFNDPAEAAAFDLCRRYSLDTSTLISSTEGS